MIKTLIQRYDLFLNRANRECVIPIFVYMLFIISWYVISNVEYVLILNTFNFIIEVFYSKIIYF